MTVTLTANYREVYSSKTIEKIDQLIEDNFDLNAILEFIDEHSEDEFVSYYEDYVDAGEKFGYEAVDAFVEKFNLDELEQFEDLYIGEFSSAAEAAQELLEPEMYRVPYCVIVDWEATAFNLLDDGIYQVGDHYFRTGW